MLRAAGALTASRAPPGVGGTARSGAALSAGLEEQRVGEAEDRRLGPLSSDLGVGRREDRRQGVAPSRGSAE